MKLPDDQTLTETGLSIDDNGGQVLLIACGALAREILDLIVINKWDHLTLTCLPAILHIDPSKIIDAVEGAVRKNQGKFAKIYVVYADCGTGGKLFDLCNKLGVEMVEGPHCYSFFEGNTRFQDRTDDDFGSFYLTDFLVRQFDAFVWKPLGLDRHPELRDMYFGNYTKLIYQVQVPNPELSVKARNCADRLGLKYEERFTGYGDMETTIKNWANPS